MESVCSGSPIQRLICHRTISNSARAIAAAALCVCSDNSPAATFEAIYAFGDSLTDTGREPAEPFLHYNGRWSNGPLWIEYLSTKLGLPYVAANNYAHSGAQVDDMVPQVAEFTPPAHPERVLFVAWAGGNDFTQTYDKNWVDDVKWDAQIQHAMTNYFQVITALYEKGARTIMVPNTVDLSQIPLLNKLPGFVRDYLRRKVQQFDSSLWDVLDQVSVSRPELRLVRVDAYRRFDDVLANSKQYGFTETKIDVLADFFLFDKRFNGPGRNYIFWDPIHPTTKSHALVADWFEEALTASGPPHLQLSRASDGLVLEIAPVQIGQLYQLQRSTNLEAWAVFSAFTALTNKFDLNLSKSLSPFAAFRVR